MKRRGHHLQIALWPSGWSWKAHPGMISVLEWAFRRVWGTLNVYFTWLFTAGSFRAGERPEAKSGGQQGWQQNFLERMLSSPLFYSHVGRMVRWTQLTSPGELYLHLLQIAFLDGSFLSDIKILYAHCKKFENTGRSFLLLRQGIATLFRKPADREDGGLVSQKTIFWESFKENRNPQQVIQKGASTSGEFSWCLWLSAGVCCPSYPSSFGKRDNQLPKH